MRLLLVADAASIHTRRWAEYFRDNGVEVHIASFRPSDIRGVKVHVLRTFGLGKLGYFLALMVWPGLHKMIRPDIVHAHYITSYGFLAALAGLHPLVVTAWGSDLLIRSRESFVMRCFARYALTHAEVVTTLADHMNPAVVSLGVDPERIVSTPFGVDIQTFASARIESKNYGRMRLICTRGFRPIYDVETLVRAIERVFLRGRELEVHLVGDGPLRQSLVELVRQSGLEARVKFHGHLRHELLAKLLAESDIFVTPALSDGNNVSLNEAMACGCFPIATNIPANTQWIDDGQNGFLYPPGDIDRLAIAIEKAIDGHNLRMSARVANRRIAETRANWRSCTRRMEAIYRQVLEKR